MFPEEFLHFIWQFQYYDKELLMTTDNQPVVVVHPGFWNHDAGPDFRQGKVRIGAIDWHGHIEIHLKSSDWYLHKHETNAAYDSVVLHVVWEADREVTRTDGTLLLQLELKNRVSLELLSKYQELIQQRVAVPCQTYRQRIDPLKTQSMLDRVVVERLQRKVKEIRLMLERLGGDWDATAVHLLTRYFGFKKNEDAFRQLSHRVSYKVLQKLADKKDETEAYLLGIAGFLEPVEKDDYALLLAEKFKYLSHKYRIPPSGISVTQWKFLRMRPANFPSLRLAQLAAIIQKSPRVFAAFLEAESVKDLKKMLRADVSPYWQIHFRFGEKWSEEKTRESHSGMGDASLEILIINCVVPLLFTYGREQGNAEVEEKALSLLHDLKFETNSITDKFKFLPVPMATAYESQACIELYHFYCMPRKCLTCQVGIDLIKQPV